jgi:stage V sporulation protein AF
VAADHKRATPIQEALEHNEQIMVDTLDIETNFDIGLRKYKVGNKWLHLYYVNSLTDMENVIQIMRQISFVDKILSNEGAYKELIEHALSHLQVNLVQTIDEAVDQLLSGLMVILGDGWDKAIVIDTRSYPGRNPEEPDTERVIRGARDGYTENIIMNAGLTRRRIRDVRLRMEIKQIGERSKTDVCISYIKDIANQALVEHFKKKLEELSIDGIPMGEKAIEEMVIKQGYNPFPKVRFTERPDVAAAHLFEGHIVIMVDTSPVVIIIPTTYFHHIQHAEEFRQVPALGMYIRWVRYLGIVASIFLLPLWSLFVFEPELLPTQLAFIGPNDNDANIPIFYQFLIAELGIDLLRMAAVHTPTPLATALGLVAAILIGQIAIDVGLFQPEVVLYVSVAAIGMFATPSYELSQANKLIRLFLLVVVYAFRAPGFIIGSTLVLIALAAMKSIRTPYLWPLIPFNFKAALSIILRYTTMMDKTRPSIVHPLNERKQS